MSAKKRKPETVWEQPWAYAWATRPAGMLTLVYLVHLVLWNVDVPVIWVAGVGTVVALMTPLLFPDFPLRDRWFYFLSAASMAAHVVWGRVTIPWGRDQLLTAFTGTILFGLWWHLLNVTRASAKGKQKDREKVAETDAGRGRYVAMIERASKRKPGTSGIKEKRRDPFPAGMRIVFDIRHLAVSTNALYDLGDELDKAADARPGTYVFERGATAGEAVLNVFERDILAETLPYPFETGPKSIHNPMQLGQYATGEVCVVTFRELAALLVGIKGRGKSALINTHLAHLTGCTDAVVWMMDGKGGETALPWLQPFLEAVKGGQVADPVAALDWVATTESEFDAMLLAARQVSKFRTKAQMTPLSPSRARPAVIVIVEEASVITGTGNYGNVKRADLAREGVVTGRSSACDWLLASQRATVTMLGSGDMKSNLDLRYGMGIIDPYDARDIFTDAKLAQSLFALGDDKRYRGVFLMQAPGSRRVMPVKGFWIDPGTIPGIAARNALYRPQLDRETADAVHDYLVKMGVPGGYHGRWDRFLKEFGLQDLERPAAEHGNRSTDTPDDTATAPESMGQRIVREAVEKHRADQDKDRFEEIVSGAGWDAETESWDSSGAVRDVPAGAPPVLRLMAQAFLARDAEQLPTKVILGDLGGTLTPHALSRLMGHCGVAPVQNIIWHNKTVRGYRWVDVETSLKRNDWPQQAFDWQP